MVELKKIIHDYDLLRVAKFGISLLAIIAGVVTCSDNALFHPDVRPVAKSVEAKENALVEREKKIVKIDPAFDSALYHMGKAEQCRDSLNSDRWKGVSNWFTNKAKHDQKQIARLKMMGAHLDSMETILYRRMKAQMPAVQNRQITPGVRLPVKR